MSENKPNNKFNCGQYVISEDAKVIFVVEEIYVNSDCFTYGNENIDGRFPESKLKLYKLNEPIHREKN